MKSIICIVLFCSCVIVGLQGAAVEPVVEELHTDVNEKAPSADKVEMELMTNEDCHQPKETGRCFALFYRFAYDVEKRECVEFIYGGCAGNSNNFESKDECEVKCMKKSEQSDVAVESTSVAATLMPDVVEPEVTTVVPVVEESVASSASSSE